MVDKRTRSKPKKPYPDFPLTYHPCGQWCKKIRGKLYYFGTDSDQALTLFLEQRDDLYADRTPGKKDELTVKLAVNHFLTAKQYLIESGELNERTFDNYKSTCAKLIDLLGGDRLVPQLVPNDFQKLRRSFGSGVGRITLRNHVQISRMVFRHAEYEGLLEGRIRFGKSFIIPSKDAIRRERVGKQREHGLRMFEAAELRFILDSANETLKAMTLLGINCAFGQTDCSTLTINCFDFEKTSVNFPRPKTGVPRICPLWPVTVQAIRNSIKNRPEPAEGISNESVFLTKNGLPYVRTAKSQRSPGKVVFTDNIGNSFNKRLKKLDLKRPGLSFYALRHTFETIAGESGDQVAVNAIMGHADQTMAGLYRERISQERLKIVVDHVHNWVFPSDDSET